jgi:HK97 family phage major capsid protein/HK97 family phage prohead protease
MKTKHIVGQITKAAGSEYDGTFVLSTDSVDRYGDVIEQNGWDLENFKRNPVALWMHDQRNPIGSWANIRVETNRLVADLKLASTNLARLARQLIDDGVLKAVSVGFLPKEAARLDEKDPSSGYLIKSAELLEVSLVSVPANQDALMIAKSLGLTDDELATVFEDHAPPAGKSADPAILERARSLLSGKSAGVTPKSTPIQEDKPMTLSERIQAKQKEMVALRDELTLAAEKYADDPSDENREAVEAFTGQIEATEKQLSTLESAEKNLAAVAVQRSQAQAPAVVQSVKNYEPGELIVRQAVVNYLAHEQHKSISEVIRERYRNDKGLEAVMTKAAAAPGDTTTSAWAASLLDDQVAGFVDLLANNSVYGALRAVGMSLNFSGYGSIKIPSRTSTKTPAGGFVGEGGAIPVKELSFTSQTLTRHKMGVIVTMTDELADATNGQIETIVRQAILDETSKALDGVLLDASAASTTRPIGLKNGVSHPASAGTTAANIIADLKTLLSRLPDRRRRQEPAHPDQPAAVAGRGDCRQRGRRDAVRRGRAPRRADGHPVRGLGQRQHQRSHLHQRRRVRHGVRRPAVLGEQHRDPAHGRHQPDRDRHRRLAQRGGRACPLAVPDQRHRPQDGAPRDLGHAPGKPDFHARHRGLVINHLPLWFARLRPGIFLDR